MDRKALKEVNYELLLTFCVFFVFSGNCARIPLIKNFFVGVLPINTLMFGILSCQFISNVPSAVLLSHFTTNYHALLPAVNIGGLGTPIASLASLITLTNYKKLSEGQEDCKPVSSYLKMFMLINFIFLAVLYVMQSMV